MDSELRVYAVIIAPIALSENQWLAYFESAKHDGLGYLVDEAAAQTGMPHNFANFGPVSPDGLWAIVDFEFVTVKDANGLDGAQRAELAVKQSTGGVGGRVGLQAVMDAEAKVRLQSAQASCEVIGYGPRMDAIAQANAWMNENWSWPSE